MFATSRVSAAINNAAAEINKNSTLYYPTSVQKQKSILIRHRRRHHAVTEM
jgi:hypothetical protein